MYDKFFSDPRFLSGSYMTIYVSAFIAALLFVGISMLVANMIAYEGGRNPRDPFKRRVWFFILGAISMVTFFLWHFLYAGRDIKHPALKDKFLLHTSLATIATFLFFLLLGIVISKLAKKGKYGTLFPSKD